MTRTLAGMSPAERDACKGMWCDYTDPAGKRFRVIYRHDKNGLSSVQDPKKTDGSTDTWVMTRCLTLLPDLPRAWGADGEPVKMSREWGIVYRPHMRGEIGDKDIYMTTSEEERVEETMEHMRKQEERGYCSDLRLMTRHTTAWEAKP